MKHTKLIALCLIGGSIALTGCASAPPSPGASASRGHAVAAPSADPGSHAALIAERQVGVRYRFGGASPASGFDCSGLVYYSFLQAGVRVPRTSREQFSAARKIALADARPGDIVFFQGQEKLSHVGIYLGQRRFVHAPSTGRTVSVALIDAPYYQEHLVGVGRLTSL